MSRRKSYQERMETARSAAWAAYGAKNYRWIVGLEMLRRLMPVVLVAAAIGIPALWIVRAIRRSAAHTDAVVAGQSHDGGLSAVTLPLILLAVSVLGLAALATWKWANVGRGGAGFGAAVTLFILLFASAILWTVAAF